MIVQYLVVFITNKFILGASKMVFFTFFDMLAKLKTIKKPIIVMLRLAPAPESSKRGALRSHFNVYLHIIGRPISSFHVKKIYSLTSNHDSNHPNLLILLGWNRNCIYSSDYGSVTAA